MKIIEILPKLDVGGVERHVIDLTGELVRRGHSLTVISGGGRMLPQLSAGVEHIELPVYKKNPFAILLCAKQVVRLIREHGCDVIHAHSRMPAWVACFASKLTGVPFVVTAHAFFATQKKWIYRPYRKADRVICVSKAVREGNKNCFHDNTTVIINGLDEPAAKWAGPFDPPARFLFIGRLSKIKGLDIALRAMPKDLPWRLDVVGDGLIDAELKQLAANLGFSERVTFHGFSDEVDRFMANASCLLFPSQTEGFALVLFRAVQIGLPVIASDVPAIAEIAGRVEGLLDSGDVSAWSEAIRNFILSGETKTKIPSENIPTLAQMTEATESVYEEAASKNRGKGRAR